MIKQLLTFKLPPERPVPNNALLRFFGWAFRGNPNRKSHIAQNQMQPLKRLIARLSLTRRKCD
jgi:hypothetical protein